MQPWMKATQETSRKKKAAPNRFEKIQVENQITKIWAYLTEHISEHGFAPSMRQLGSYVGITPKSAQRRIEALERMGHITIEPKKARGIKLIHGFYYSE